MRSGLTCSRIEQGGKLEIVRTEKGDVGWCVLPDGRRIEEWQFFRARNEPRKDG